MDDLINPYNELNVEITENDVLTILTKYGLPPKIYNFDLYKRAFVHESYLKKSNKNIVPKPTNCVELKSKSNERLEFLGDGVLELITKYYLYRRFYKEEPEFMTTKKIEIVKNESIGSIAKEIGLHKWLLLSKRAEDENIRLCKRRLGCLFEAFIGAIFLDFNKIQINDDDKWFKNIFICGPGFQMSQIFIENIFSSHINWTDIIMNDTNYKNLLQVKIQKEFKITPLYKIIQQDKEIGFKMGVYLSIGNNTDSVTITDINNIEDIYNLINNNSGNLMLFLGQGINKIKKKAEQQACFNALEKLKGIL
uniref:RNase III domain-containing protein n=1 Tax=viral metagenome TaxID=1070528 RepID=A0A6C0H565_9ZZZZ